MKNLGKSLLSWVRGSTRLENATAPEPETGRDSVVFPRLFCLFVGLCGFLLVSHVALAKVDKTEKDKKLPKAAVSLSPPRADIVLGKKPVHGALELKNLRDEPVTIKVEVFNWEYDEKMKVHVIPPTDQSLDQWMIVNPMQFTLQPKQVQTIRYLVRPFVKPADGEHRAVIFFSEQAKKTDALLTVTYRVGAFVYGLAGNIVRDGTVNSVKMKTFDHVGEDNDVRGVGVFYDLTSTGNANLRLDGQITLWEEGKFPGVGKVGRIAKTAVDKYDGLVAVTNMSAIPVLPGKRQKFNQGLRIPDEKAYVVYVNGTFGKTSIQKLLRLQRTAP